jgi:predicted GNAT family acetyltransferase
MPRTATRNGSVTVLTDASLDEVLEFLGREPVVNVFALSRIEAAGLDPQRLGAEVWGYADRESGALTAVCYSGANLIPAGDDPRAVRAFADKARRQGRRCSSIVGPLAMVEPLWRLLLPHWGEARDIRPVQPLLAISTPPQIAGDPGVRRVRTDEIDVILPACVAMFTEEVGVSPLGADGGLLYRSRVAELVAEGRAFAKIDGARVLFKAEVGAATREACQVQGVWVDPELRGQGMGSAGMAAVVEQARRSIAPVVSLYVNDFNVPARDCYTNVGFEQVGTFMSVLF